MSSHSGSVAAPTPGRECGPCSMCCKLVAITELGKPEGVWCEHAIAKGGGCRIYADRPASCRSFFCGWLQTENFGPEWKPTTSKMVIVAGDDHHHLTIYVDPNFPTAWRKEPYYSQIRQLGATLTIGGVQVLVQIKNRVVVILPDKEVDLGECSSSDHVRVGFTPATGGWRASRIEAKDVPPDQREGWTVSHRKT